MRCTCKSAYCDPSRSTIRGLLPIMTFCRAVFVSFPPLSNPSDEPSRGGIGMVDGGGGEGGLARGSGNEGKSDEEGAMFGTFRDTR